MGIEIRLLDKFELVDLETGITVPVRSYARIYTLLACQGKSNITRSSLIRNLWPLDEYAVANNRLRVALSNLRTVLGKGLITENDTVEINLDVVKVDFLHHLNLLKKSQDEIDDQEFLSQNLELLPALQKKLLPDGEDIWILEHQNLWRETVTETLALMSKIAWETNQIDKVQDIAKAGLVHVPYSDLFWQYALKASRPMGDYKLVLASFESSKRAYKEAKGGSFSDETISTAGAFSSDLNPSSVGITSKENPQEQKLFWMILSTITEKNIGLASEIFGSVDAFEIMRNNPVLSIELLQNLVSKTTKPEPYWQQLTSVLAMLYASREDFQNALSLGYEVLPYINDPKMRAKLCAALAVGKILKQETDAAKELLEESQNLHISLGETELANHLNVLIGSCYYHEADFENAIDYLNLAIENLKISKKIPNLKILINLHTCNCGIFMLIYGDEKRAWEYFEEGIKHLISHNSENQFGLTFSAYGYLKYSYLGDKSGLELIVHALKSDYKQQKLRFQFISAMYVGAILAKEQKFDLSLSVMNYLMAWREADYGPHTAGEMVFVNRILQSCQGHKPSPTFDDEMSRKDYLQFLVKELRKIR